MKLIPFVSTLSILLATLNAQTIDTLIQELVDHVYQVSDDGKIHTVNISPYYQSITSLRDEGYTTKGSFGNGNGVISFTEKIDWTGGDHLSYKWSGSGDVKSHPLVACCFPEEVLADTFTSEFDYYISATRISHKEAGTYNGIPFSNEASLSINPLQITSKQYTAQMSFSRVVNIPTSIHEFWRKVAIFFAHKSGSTDVVIKATAKASCAASAGLSPIDKSCSADLVITGDNDGVDIGKHEAKYRVQPKNKKALLAVTHNGNIVFRLSLTGIDLMEVLAIKYRPHGGKVVLVIQFVGPAGIVAVTDSIQAFFKPFQAFVGGLTVTDAAQITHLNFDEIMHAVVYMDEVFLAIQGKQYFNLYPIMKATQLKSDLLAKKYEMKDVQSATKAAFDFVNKSIEEFAAETAPVVSKARTYINGVTSASGKAKFDAWFTKL